MMAIVAWLTGQAWFRKVAVVLGLILAVLLALAGIRRSAEKTGRLIEREAHRVEKEKTRERVEEVKKQIDAVPRPSDSDVNDRLRDGTF